MAKPLDITGHRFGRLVAVRIVGKVAYQKRSSVMIWECACDCGGKRDTRLDSLRQGYTKSCGCLYHDGNNSKHRLSNSAEYRAWAAMKTRCFNKNSDDYKNYGERGIIVCHDWIDDFMAFYNHIGPKPSPELTLERKNNNLGYEPGNVCWATRSEQNSNRRRWAKS